MTCAFPEYLLPDQLVMQDINANGKIVENRVMIRRGIRALESKLFVDDIRIFLILLC